VGHLAAGFLRLGAGSILFSYTVFLCGKERNEGTDCVVFFTYKTVLLPTNTSYPRIIVKISADTLWCVFEFTVMRCAFRTGVDKYQRYMGQTDRHCTSMAIYLKQYITLRLDA
jgi:hypothetical protein